MKLKISKLLLESALIFQARNDVRYYLNGICFMTDGRFPDIDRVIPKETKAAEEIGFNAGYLVDIEKVAKLFNPKFSSVKLELNGNTNAAVCCLSAPSGETAKIVVMPMRL